MKIKELQKTVNVAWSPEQINPIYLAAGTAAQQLDYSSSTSNSTLEIYSPNLLDPGYELQLKGTQTSNYRFQKIIWSPTGINNGAHTNGLIVGGCEGGHIQIYDASKLLSSTSTSTLLNDNNNFDDLNNNNALVSHQSKHTGTVRGLDFNPFQQNLLASVASESEIFIWDLNNTTTPMSPGTKTQPLEDIQNVAWNKQVQHILSTVFSSKCVVWDLRKNEQIMKLNDTQSRVRWRAIQWHPDIATQLWLASEEDQAPYVQLWDLRYATAPTKTMQIHSRGILGLTWCPKDSDLMISCGKDNKIYCWNPNTEIPEGEILSEVATTLQWYSDVQWCPRDPSLIASSSFDGNVSIYSLFGGTHQQVQTSNKIADSFPGMDQMQQIPQQQNQITQNVYSDLKKAPKWMKKPSGVSFGFGGRLLKFNNKNQRIINICQVITEPQLIERSNALENVINECQFIDYCRKKADEMNDQNGRYLWYFLKANFEENPKNELLNLLGYNREDFINKFNEIISKNNDDGDSDPANNQINHLTKQISVLSHGGDNNALFDAITASNKVMNEMTAKKNESFKIPTGDGNKSLICQAILTGNIEAAAELCLEFNCPAEALIIASTSGTELLYKIQKRYLNKVNNNNKELSNIVNALLNQDWYDIAIRCTIDSWKEALVAALTHNDEQKISFICDKLGERLQNEINNDPKLGKNSILCYLCSGNIEKLVESWLLIKKSNNNYGNDKLTTDELQELIEIVMIFKKSLELRGQNLKPNGKLAELLAQYASLLAAQGELDAALSYLGPTQNPQLEELRERLYYALGHKRQQTTSTHSNVSQYNQQVPSNIFDRKQSINNNLPIESRYCQPEQLKRNSFSNQLHQQSNTQLPLTISSNSGTGLPGLGQWNSTPLQQNQQLQQQQPSPLTQLWNTNAVQSTSMPQPLHTPYDSSASQNTSSMLPPPPPSSAMASQSTALSKPPPLPPTMGASSANESLNRPQRPSSVGSQGSLRSKYVLDPSVTSGPNYGQTNVYNPMLAPAPNPSLFNNNQSFNSPTNSSVVQNNFQPFTPAPLASAGNNFFQNSAVGGGSYLSGVPPIETAQQALPPPPSLLSSGMNSSIGGSGGILKNPTPPPGWNDPPALKNSRQQVFYTQKNEMSAEHAGTRKWGQIINNNSNSSFNFNESSNNEQKQQQKFQQKQQKTSQPIISSDYQEFQQLYQQQIQQHQEQQSVATFNLNQNYNFNQFSSSSTLSPIIPATPTTPIKNQQPKNENSLMNPITHPIFGVDPNQGQNGYKSPESNNIPGGYSSMQAHLSSSSSSSLMGGTATTFGSVMTGSNVGGGSNLLPPPPPPSSSSSSSYLTPNTFSSATTAPPPLLPSSSSPLPPIPPISSTSSSIISPQEAPSTTMNKMYNPLNFQGQAIQQQQYQPQQSRSLQQSQMYESYKEVPTIQPKAIIEKPPLPEEFIYMQTVFEELKNQCQNVAPDPRTKRKFVDVTKRLEALYDILRANRLSQSTLSSLNQIVQYIQIGDYHNAMNVYMTIVSGPDFSQAANFMPGIKVLVQSASELKVYLR